MNGFLEAVKNRRSRYAISGKSPVSDAEIVEIIQTAVKYAPTAFNSQGARLLVLFGAQHQKFWDLTKEILRERIPADKFASTDEKINSFAAGHGTVLYFEEWNTVAGLQAKFPSYKENFPIWACQSNGMLEYIIWTALEAEGLGASLQHYNPIVDEKVREVFGVPSSWKLLAQMPFGLPTAPAGEKTFMPLEERVIVLK